MIEVRRVDENIVARAASFFLFKSIEIGYGFYRLSREEQDAVMAHEQGHIAMRHTEKRILCLLLMPPAILFLYWWQELSADRYAARKGHARGLMRYFRRHEGGGLLHPSNLTRMRLLKKYEQKISLASR